MPIVQGFKNILVLTDFSPASWEALKYGVLLHKCVEADITILHVLPGKVASHKAKDKETAGVMLEKMKLMQREMKLNGNSNTVVLHGNVAQEIRNHLDHVHYDLIVMGINGNGGLNSVMGKNTRMVIESAEVPVMVLPPKADQPVTLEA